jgi:hypothetical protein
VQLVANINHAADGTAAGTVMVKSFSESPTELLGGNDAGKKTRSEGRFVFEGLAAGTYTVRLIDNPKYRGHRSERATRSP